MHHSKISFKYIGNLTVSFLESYGKLSVLAFDSFWAIRKVPDYLPQVVEQFIEIGRKSLPIVLITASFIGLALGVQIGTQMNAYTPKWMEGGLILRSMLLEMGPIVTGLILSGRIASGIASELGAMKVTEQIDALRVLAIDPIEYLITPRLVAAIIALPILLVFADLFGILAGFFSAHFTINLSWEGFVKGMQYDFVQTDVFTSLIKSVIFGVVIVIFGSFFGLNSKHGAKGVGSATTLAVVWASVAVLGLDYIISAILFFIW